MVVEKIKKIGMHTQNDMIGFIMMKSLFGR